MVQIDGRRKIIRDAAAVRKKFRVIPPLVPDVLALVGERRNPGEGATGLSKSSAKKGAKKSAVKKAKPKK